jgi:hypothetical protein
MEKVIMKVNGRSYQFIVEPDRVLLDLLREDLRLTGTKQSCDKKGQCGACTVIVNGKAVRSCLQKVVNLNGAEVITVEGLIPFSQPFSEKFLAVAIISSLSFINYRGVRLSGTVQDIFTLGNFLIMLTLIVGGFISGNGNWQHFTASSSASLPFSRLFGPAMIAIIFTYSGWFVSAYVGGEIKKPERNLPLSLSGDNDRDHPIHNNQSHIPLRPSSFRA